jgi:C-terminal processing protease CtpA/Prc
MGKQFFFALAFAAVVVGAQGPVTPSSPQNLGFTGEVGKVPPGWFVSTPGYTARLTEEEQSPGKRAVELTYGEQKSPFGNLMQTFDATAYRGKQVRFRAAVRMTGEGPADAAQLWFRVDRKPGVMGFFDNMGNRPIRSRDWQYFEIVANVEHDAQKINIGMMLIRTGRAWISDASLDVIADLPTPVIEAARPLTPRGLRNETAFARLFGYVRYFHPSDEAAKTNWDAFAITGARAIESARDDAELAQKLSALFETMSPTVRVLTSGQQYSTPAALRSSGNDPKVIYWKHFGVGLATGAQSIYHSERIQETASAASRSKAPVPDSPFKTDLVPGVTAWVPGALYVDGQGTLPHSSAAQAGTALAPQPNWSGDDRGTRLGDVIVAWNVFEHFYPYFDIVKSDWTAELPRALEAAASDKDEIVFTDTLQRLVAALHDGHGRVNKPGLQSGFLPVHWDWVDGALVITEVAPAALGVVSRGDVVLKIAGRLAADALNTAEALVSGATPQWIRYRGLQELARGPVGTIISLEIESASDPGKAKTVPVRFESAAPPEEKRPAKIAELEPGIYYVDVGRVSNADFQGALADLQKARGIVFDFRGYPGNLPPNFLTYLYDKPMTSAQWHVPSVMHPDHLDMQFERGGEWNLRPSQPYLTAKKTFITDGRAISYAESCMGIVENYKLGAIVGAPTAGTNGNVNPFTLPGGYTIQWTGMKVLKHDGSQHHGVGILPTIPVSRTRAGIAAGRDEFLESAIAAVKN